MFNYNHLLMCALVPLFVQACDSGNVTGAEAAFNPVGSVGDLGVGSALADSANLDIGGSDLVYAPFCQEEPFGTSTTGTYKGVIANEIFSEISRCEFDITLTIEAPGADNQSCDQTGTLSFTGTQTVSSDFPTVCGSIENQSVTIGWNLQEYTEPSDDGSQVVLVRDLSYPLEGFVSTWGIERFPDETDDGVQIEYPGILYSLDLTRNLTISGGDIELYTGELVKVK